MNRSRTKGMLLTLLGKLQRNVGSAIGNPHMVHKGHLHIIEGRSALAIGEAQALIKRCLAYRGQPRAMQGAKEAS